MPRISSENISRERELIILEACRDLAEELSLIDAADYICLLQTGNLVALADLVSSSIEPYFDERALSFACSGHCRVSWEESPSVGLDFEFLHGGVFAFFRLILSQAGPDVELNHISFDQVSQSPAANTSLLNSSLQSARVSSR